jgi:hypothetical protein
VTVPEEDIETLAGRMLGANEILTGEIMGPSLRVVGDELEAGEFSWRDTKPSLDSCWRRGAAEIARRSRSVDNYPG